MVACPRPMRLMVFTASVWAATGVHAESVACDPDRTPAGYDPTGAVTIVEAVAAAFANHPDLVAAECRIAAAEARIIQAGLRPNPVAGFEVENFAGGGNRSGAESAESTLGVSQLIELGGKRARRISVAGLDRDLETWNREAKRLDVITDTRKAFIAVLIAQRRLTLAEDLAKLADEGVRVVGERIAAGQVSPVEEARARVAATRTHIEGRRAEAGLAAARRRLAAQWGSDTPGFDHAEADPEAIAPLPEFDRLEGALAANPDLARWATEIEQRQALQRLAATRRSPDITVGGGVRHFADEGDVALVATISVPLPLFDRGQGSIAETRYLALAAEAEQEITRTRLRLALQDAYQQLKLAHAEVRITRDEILPAAKYSFDAITKGYRYGKFGYLEVLDAQRTLFEARSQYLAALENYHAAAADAERLLGADMNEGGDLASPVAGDY